MCEEKGRGKTVVAEKWQKRRENKRKKENY